MKKALVFVVIFTICISFIPVSNGYTQQSEPIMKVKLLNYLGNKKEITLIPNGDYVTNQANIVLKSNHTYLLKQVHKKLSLFENGLLLGSFETFSAQPVQPRAQLSINGRLYLGSFDFIVENDQFVRPINYIYMEDYLKGVVPIEMYPSWDIEALKTQAVAARTYAMNYINRGIINDTISYQVYGGYIWTPTTTKAVDATKGQVLQYKGRLIDALYSASNGGVTESNDNAWGNTAVPYLKVKKDPFDPKTTWTFSFHKTQIDVTTKDLAKPSQWWATTKEKDATISSNIKTWLKSNGYANKDIKIISIPEFSLYNEGSGGRVKNGNITVEFLVKDEVDKEGTLIPQRVSFSNTSASKVRAIIGNRVMLSYLVDEVKSGMNLVRVKGLGDGHGIGMSQWGAKYMADAGKSYKDILQFYYSGIGIVKMYEPSSKTEHSSTVEVAAQPISKPTIKDTKAPIIKDVKTSYNNNTKKVSLTYSMNETSKVTVHIRNSKGKIIKHLEKQVKKSPRTHTISWNVASVPNGTYTFGIVTTDLAGNTSSAARKVSFKKVKTGKINASNVLIRQKASTSAKSVGKLKKNQRVAILSKKGSWHYIQYGKTKGYVYSKYISGIK